MGRGDHLNNDATFFTFRYVREGVFGRRIQSDTEEEDARREGLLLSVLQAHDQVLRLQHTRQSHQGKYSNNFLDYQACRRSPISLDPVLCCLDHSVGAARRVRQEAVPGGGRRQT